MKPISLLITVAIVMAMLVAMSAAPAMVTKFPPGTNCGHDSPGFFTFSQSLPNPNVKFHDCEPG